MVCSSPLLLRWALLLAVAMGEMSDDPCAERLAASAAAHEQERLLSRGSNATTTVVSDTCWLDEVSNLHAERSAHL